MIVYAIIIVVFAPLLVGALLWPWLDNWEKSGRKP